MKKVLLPLAVAAVLAAVVIGIRMLAGGGGRAQQSKPGRQHRR